MMVKKRSSAEEEDSLMIKSNGEIGDDFISFDFSSESEEAPRHSEGDNRRDSQGHGNDSRESRNSKPLVKKPAGSVVRRSFSKSAPWFPKGFSSKQLAEHYGWISKEHQVKSSHKANPRPLHFALRLHRELQDLTVYLSPTREEESARMLLIKKCDVVVRKLFPGKRIECFGSVASGLWLPSSDVDLVVVDLEEEVGAEAEELGAFNGSHSRAGSPLRRLARTLIKTGIAEPSSVQVISKARVPIIKFVDRFTGFPVDISFDISSGVEGTHFLRRQLGKYPAMRPLILVLKLFLDLRGLNEVFRGGLGSFSVACLVLSFLQVHPLLQLGYLHDGDNLGVLLMEFLEFYGKQFNYERVGITVGNDDLEAEGKSSKTADSKPASDTFNTPTSTMFISAASASASSAFESAFGYYDKADRLFFNDSRPSLLSIQDPQCPSNDLARPSFLMGAVRSALEHAFSVLNATALEVDEASEEQPGISHDSKSHKYRNQMQHHARRSTEGSLLSGLIFIPDRIIRHRDHITQVMQSERSRN